MGTERVTLEMSIEDIVLALAEGNPGAARVCVELLAKGEEIDPDNALGGFGTMLLLDTLGLYGSRIWMLYKDVCGQDLVKMVAVLRAWQLAILTSGAIAHAIDHRGEGVDTDNVVSQVQEQCPGFNAIARLTNEE